MTLQEYQTQDPIKRRSSFSVKINENECEVWITSKNTARVYLNAYSGEYWTDTDLGLYVTDDQGNKKKASVFMLNFDPFIMVRIFETYKKIQAKFDDCFVFVRHEDDYICFNQEAKLIGSLFDLETKKFDHVHEYITVPFSQMEFKMKTIINSLGVRIALCDHLTK